MSAVASKSPSHSAWDYNPCNYAFVGEVGSFNFSDVTLNLAAEDCNKIRVPVGYDWFVGLSESCSEAEKAGNGTLICGSNTQCVDANEGDWGYLCRCLDGYRGNPYLPHGCQDMNECAEKRLNDCERQEYCANTIGGYVCRCPHGHHGSGTRANPCIAPAATLLKLILGVSISMGLMISIIVIYGLFKLFPFASWLQENIMSDKRLKNGCDWKCLLRRCCVETLEEKERFSLQGRGEVAGDQGALYGCGAGVHGGSG